VYLHLFTSVHNNCFAAESLGPVKEDHCILYYADSVRGFKVPFHLTYFIPFLSVTQRSVSSGLHVYVPKC
jgi:hypothetical protein